MDTGSDGLSEYRTLALKDVLDSYDVVKANSGYIIVAERPAGMKLAGDPNIDPGFAIQELGYTSLSPWTAWTRDEQIPQLRAKQGIRTYYDMKRNDGTVRGMLRLVKTPIQSAHWFIEPASDSTIDGNIAAFVEDCLFNQLNVDWSQVLDDVLLMFEYGHIVFEKVYEFDKKGRIVLQKLGPRHPLDIMEWIFDNQGGPAGIVMEPFVPYGNLSIGDNLPGIGDPMGYRIGQFIPVSKLVIFSMEPEAGDLRGISVLRSAYKHWFYKDTLYKIDAIQKERHGIGVPVIKLPPGFTQDDKALADQLGRNLRTNDRAHIVIPANWEIIFAELKGQPTSALESITHHNEQILINILAPFITDARARDVSADMFLKSTRYIANAVANIFNRYVIEQLVDLNFRVGGYPKLRARRIGEWDDLRTLSFALRNFVGAGLITPDDTLEEQLRDEADLPPQDFATSRRPATPQVPGGGQGGAPAPAAPPKVGPPRQSSKPPVGPPSAGAGRDAGGGGGKS